MPNKIKKIKYSDLKMMPRVRAPCEESMQVGTNVEYQLGVADYGRGTVTAVDLENDSVSISGCSWSVPLKHVIALDMLDGYNAWRSLWIEMARTALPPFGMDVDEVVFFASDNDGNLRSDFKLGMSVENSVEFYGGFVASIPSFG